MSAFGPRAAGIAGRLADGVWRLAAPDKAPAVIAAYRRACEQAGREPGEIIMQGLAAAGDSDEVALASSREWKGTLVDKTYSADVHDPARIGELGEDVSDRTFKMMGIVSADPAAHVRKIKAMRALGATAVVIINVSGADPMGALRLYGDHVLPALRNGSDSGSE